MGMHVIPVYLIGVYVRYISANLCIKISIDMHICMRIYIYTEGERERINEERRQGVHGRNVVISSPDHSAQLRTDQYFSRVVLSSKCSCKYSTIRRKARALRWRLQRPCLGVLSKSAGLIGLDHDIIFGQPALQHRSLQ